MKTLPRLLVVLGVLGLTACDTGPKGSVGFTLPDGDIEKGKANYIAFQCHACHDSEQVPQMETEEPPVMSVTLGGETTRIKSYGELVTSVINPSHRVPRRSSADMADQSGQSKMVNFNDIMTVTQMIDLVAFMQSNYTLSPYANSNYPVYWIPEPGEKK